MVGHIGRAGWQFLWTFALSIPMVLLGLPLVALGLLFRREYPETARPFTQYPADVLWTLVRLPGWLKPWDNAVDGFYGDRRGWWHAHAEFEGGSRRFANMWWWGATRNTADYWRRFMISCPVDECELVKLAGNADEVNANGRLSGWNFLLAVHRKTGKRWYQLCVVRPWSETRCFNVWLGWKFKLSHAGEHYGGEDAYKRFKGFEFLIHPWKAFKD